MTTTHEPDADALESGIAAASQPSSRRGMLKLAGAVAVGAAATVAMKSGQAAAATGGNLTIGGANLATNVNEDITYLTGPFHAQTTTTLSTYQNTTGVNVGWNWVNAANGLTHAGVLGVATRFPLFPSGTAVGNGVVGLAGDNTTGAGVYANSSSTAAAGTSPGLKARSTNGPAALLVPVATGAPGCAHHSLQEPG